MGACSSKPKTAEFEGSTEPSKKAEDVGADRSIDAVDAVDAAKVFKPNEPGKEEGGVADAGAEALLETRELIASKNEEPLIKELLSTAEGVSYSVKAHESSAVDGESGDSAAEKVEVDAGDVRKVDVGDDVADYKEVLSDKATTVDGGVGGDQDKLFEDKAVVLDEASNGVVGKGDACIDKAVAADEEKAHESSDKGSGGVLVYEEESRNFQDINEAHGVESPITGVVQFAEPIHMNDVSDKVGPAAPEISAHGDSKVSQSLDEIESDILTGPNIGEDGTPPTEEAAILSSASPQEAPQEKEEDLLNDDNSKDEIKSDILTGPNMGEDGIPPIEEAANRSSGPPQEAPQEKEEVLHDVSKDEIKRDILTGPEDGIPPTEEATNLSPGSPQEEKEEVLQDDSKDEIERDILTGPNIAEDGIPPTEEAVNLSSSSPQEAPEEKEEVLHDDSKGSPLLVSVSDDGVGQESGADDARGEEVPLASADAQDEKSIEDATKPETIKDPQNDIEESTSEPQEESFLEKMARESHAEVTKNEGNPGILDDLEAEAPKVHEGIDAEASIEPKAETRLEQAIGGQGEGLVDEPCASNVQPQALAIEETAEDGKPEATPDEAIAETDREEKVEKPHIEEATITELEVGSGDAGNLELSVEAIAEPSPGTDREEKVEKPHIEEVTANELKVESGDAGNLESSVEAIVVPSANTDREEKVEKPHIEEATTNELKVDSGDAGSFKSSVEAIVEPSAETDREEKVGKPLIEEAISNELKVESGDARNLETSVEQAIKASGESDLVFEDASDVPLKVESNTIESGDKPNS